MKEPTKHDMADAKFYSAWGGMKSRCLNKSHKAYARYGGRGITFDESWNSFSAFKEDMYEEYLEHLRTHKYTSLDRIDNDSNYSKENCRWTTHYTQQRNRSDSIIYKGENQLDASIRLGGSPELVGSRRKRGWSTEKAFTVSIRKYTRHYK